MYREWTRDFRRCKLDCKKAISRLKKGTLFKWYARKMRKTKSLARMMLSGSQKLNMVHQLPDSETDLTIPSDLVTMERFDEEIDEETDEYTIIYVRDRAHC
jgi:hypothetical protein